MHLPTLETPRLRIRELSEVDLDACEALYRAIGWTDAELPAEDSRRRRTAWLDWSIRNYAQLANLQQPPYGDRAVCVGSTGTFVGLVGVVPVLVPIGQLPGFGGVAQSPFEPQIGLFWAVSPAFQGQGYAAEAAKALVDHLFESLRLRRIVAATKRDNAASLAVMRKLGMRIETNPYPDPPWFQCVGILER